MGKKDKNNPLDKDSNKRLEKLGTEWSDNPGKFTLANLTSSDLRLLLEHFAPLQDLIRAIAATPANSPEQTAELHPEAASVRKCQADEHTTPEGLQEQLQSLQTRLQQAEEQKNEALTTLDECTTKAKKLLDEKKALEQSSDKLEKQLQQTLKELKTCKTELSNSGQAPSELAWLRQEPDLAQQLGLAKLPTDNHQALIQMVAVLAQRDNLERLWNALKDRCELQNRSANKGEMQLLDAALTWYNFNWQNRPYRRIEATEGSAYDYERHLRSRHTTVGEKVTELRLPGIADGSNKPICKAMVTTG